MKSLFNFDNAFERNLDKDDQNGLTSRMIKIRTRVKFESKLKRENVLKLITYLPESGESLHIVSNGGFDYFTILPHIIEMTGLRVDEFYFSTWTLSITNVEAILNLYDRGIFANIHALTGDYMKTRESNVYNNLLTGLEKRGQKLSNNKNHSKVTLMAIAENRFIIEGSANFTANPRIEQFILSNNVELYEFHKTWMNQILIKYAQY